MKFAASLILLAGCNCYSVLYGNLINLDLNIDF